LPPAGYFDAHVDNKARYAADYGDDANDGYSWRSPKKHILAAYDELPNGGSMYIMDNTYVGGEVPGQGIWLTDSATIPTGWRRAKKCNWYGIGGAQALFSFPMARVLRGRAGDVTKPGVRFDVGIWITNNNGNSMTFNNLLWKDFSIGCRIGCTDDPMADPDVVRGSAYTAAMILFNQCTFTSDGGGSDIGEGPRVDMGYFLWVYFNQCCAVTYPEIASMTSDRRALWLVKPSDGTSMFQLQNCRGAHGGVVYQNGPSTWGFNVTDLLVESNGQPLPTLFKATGLNNFGNGYLNNITSADDAGGSDPRIVIETSPGFLPTSLVVTNCPGIISPTVVMGVDSSSDQSLEVTPAGLGQMGFIGGRIIGNTDIARFAGPVISNRYENLVPQRASADGASGAAVNPTALQHETNRIWTQSGVIDGGGGGSVVDSPIGDHQGGTNGIQISTSNTSETYQRLYFSYKDVTAGDYFIIGAWMRHPNGYAGGTSLSLTLTNGDLSVIDGHLYDASGELHTQYKGLNEWVWVQGYSKVLSLGVTTQALVNAVVKAIDGHPVQFSGATLLHLRAADINANEIGELLQNMQPFLQVPKGWASTQPGQKLLAHGGLAVGNIEGIDNAIPKIAQKQMKIYDQRGTFKGYVEIKQEIAPGSPLIWYDAQNIDGLGNESLTDGQQISTWKNLGSLSGADLTATGTDRPVFQLIKEEGKLNNLAVVSTLNVDRLLSTPSFTPQVQPNTVVILMRPFVVASTIAVIVNGDSGASAYHQITSIDGALTLYAGGSVDSGLDLAAGQYQKIGTIFDGASSSARVDGTTGSSVNPGSQSLGKIQLFGDGTGHPFIGEIVEVLVYAGTSVSRSTIFAYLDRKYGTTPQ
jgi:hypothetical protein